MVAAPSALNRCASAEKETNFESCSKPTGTRENHRRWIRNRVRIRRLRLLVGQSLSAPMLWSASKLLFELFRKLKWRVEAEDIGNLLNRSRSPNQEVLGPLQPHLTVILLWTETNTSCERLPKMGVTDAKFRCKRGHIQWLPAS